MAEQVAPMQFGMISITVPKIAMRSTWPAGRRKPRP
jgi:hypothetical protein